MRSPHDLELTELERDLPTTAEDVAALRRARAQARRMDLDAYLAFLEAFDDPPVEVLRARGTHEGAEPFEL
jgi:hypothetical protein